MGAGAGAGIDGPNVAAIERPRPARVPHVFGTGTVFLDYRGNDRGGLGALVTLFPRGFWFVRGGGEWTPYSPYGRSRFLWGLGYDDWHDGTFSATVHNWGAIRTENEGDPYLAELNVGYKIPRLCLQALCLAAYPSLTVPFQGGPWVSGRLTLTLWQSWFVMGGLGWTIRGVFPPPAGVPTGHVFWGIGLQSWRSGSLFLTYYDWGPDARQRTGSGVLSFGVNWRL
jgi:hypothetical protein